MVESVNILVNSNGQIIRSDVVGALKMRTYLRSVCCALRCLHIDTDEASTFFTCILHAIFYRVLFLVVMKKFMVMETPVIGLLSISLSSEK